MHCNCKTFIILLTCLMTGTLHAQLPVAPNGKYLNVNGRNIYYEDTGVGKPLLLLHGFGRTVEDWKPLMPGLARNHRVIAIDLPGHGRSDMIDTTEEYYHRHAASQILDFIDAMKLDSLDVMGFSSGAFITLYLATIKPALTKKIIVIAGQLYYSDSTRKFITSLGGPENFVNNTAELSQAHGLKKGNLLARQFWNFRKLYGDPSFTPDILASIRAKTLVVHGDNDPAAPVENAFMMYRHIPNAHLWVLPFAEHIGFFMPENQQELLRRTMDFLDRD